MASLRNNIQRIDFYGESYKATPIVFKCGKITEKMNYNLLKETQRQNILLTNLLSAIMPERTTVVENTINLDGRVVARGTAKYIENELSTISSRISRLGGIL